MKKIMMAMAAALMLLTACDKGETTLTVETTPPDSMKTKEIIFTFGSYSQSSMTRASLTDAQMTDLWLFDYLGDELVQTIHQTSDMETFGALSVNSDYGQHHFYFVASRGKEPDIDGTMITWAKPSDTFWQKLDLDIQPTTSGSQQVSLVRLVTKLKIAVTDEIPTNLKTLIVTPATWCNGIDYTDGSPVQETQGTPHAVTVPETYIGTTNLVMSIFGFCGSNEFQTDVAVSANDGDSQPIASITLPSVPFRRNRVTSYSGSLFGQTRAFDLSLNDEWEDDYARSW